MPKSSAPIEVIQDSEDEQPKSPKKKHVEDAGNQDGDEAADKSAPENDDEEEEEEYEIEAILEAKHGAFPGGRMGYLVKWKGYDDSHNSWVDQEDAINATDLIDDYWNKQTKEKKGKPKSKSRSRKSVARDESPDDAEPPSSNKRKKSISRRKSKSSQPEGDDDDEEEEEEEKPKAKKAKKTSRAKEATSEDRMLVDDGDDAESQYRPMQKFKDKKSWENLVERVDTIEKVEGTLKVFFTLNNGDKVVESSQECARHFPQKLIQFYESNLRWRETE